MQLLRSAAALAIVALVSTAALLALESGGTRDADAAPAPQPSDLVLILDASGSMDAKIRGEAKIEIARRVLRDLLRKVPQSTPVGLVAYGHRTTSDCADIETISLPGALDRAKLAAKVGAIDAKGKTPIHDSVKHVLDDLAKRGRPATIVLVSDGMENCGGDACELVRTARESGARFVLHVVGFDLGRGDVAPLECIAQAGGGLYFPANDAAQLSAALTEAAAFTPESPAGRLMLTARADGKLADALITVRRAGAKGEPVTQVRTYDSSTFNPRVLPLPDGTYDVAVEALGIEGRPRRELAGIAIAKGATVERLVDFDIAALAVRVTRNGKLSDATVSVREAGTSKVIASGRTYAKPEQNPIELQLPPGKYDVEVASVEVAGRPSARWEGVELAAGAKVERAQEFATGTLAVGARRGSALVDAVVEVFAAGAEASVVQGRTYTSAKSNPKSFELAPGRYVVRVKPVKAGGETRQIEANVEAGARTERTIDLPADG